MTTSEPPRPYWGDLLKSNWNGTYFGSSIPNVNRDHRGYVDFEKMIGLDGIAIVGFGLSTAGPDCPLPDNTAHMNLMLWETPAERSPGISGSMPLGYSQISESGDGIDWGPKTANSGPFSNAKIRRDCVTHS